MRKIGEIPRMPMPSEADFVEKVVMPGKPVILLDAYRDWAAWTWDDVHFLKEIGDMEVTYRKMVAGRSYAQQNSKENAVLRGSFRHYHELMQKSNAGKGDIYFLSGDITHLQNGTKVHPSLKSLHKDVNIPSYAEKTFQVSGFWCSPRGINSWLHHDVNFSNINAQIKGKKRAILLHPKEVEHFPMQTGFEPPYRWENFVQVDFWNVDHERFPNAHKASYIDAELCEGETLYIPPYWIHAFEHLGDMNINVNLWWDTQDRYADNLKVHRMVNLAIIEKLVKWKGMTSPEEAIAYFAEHPEVYEFLMYLEAAVLGYQEAPKIRKFTAIERLGLKILKTKKKLFG